MSTPRTDHEIAVEFGRQLRRYREAAGLSQEHLAHEAGLSWSTVSQVERGERAVRLTTLLRLARALGVTGSELIASLD